MNLRRVRWPLVALVLGLNGMAAAAERSSECTDLSIELAATVTPQRRAVETQDLSRARTLPDRCAALAKVYASLRDVRAEYDDRHSAPGLDVVCDHVRTALDGDAEWVAQHNQALGCNLPG